MGVHSVSRRVLRLLSLFASAPHPSALEGREEGLRPLRHRGVSVMVVMMVMGRVTIAIVAGRLRRTAAKGRRVLTLVHPQLRRASGQLPATV